MIKSKKYLSIKNMNFIDAKSINKSILRQYGIIIALWAIITFALIATFSLYTYQMNVMYNTNVIINGEVHTVAEWRNLLPSIEIGSKQQAVYSGLTKQIFGTSDNVMVAAKFMPLVWFSCMLFIPNFSTVSDWKAVWEAKLLSVTTSQIYILISTILAFVGLIMYLYVVIQYQYKLYQSNKKGFTNKYPLYKNDLRLYTNTSYLNFVIAVSIFFSFYALSATTLMLCYMLVIRLIYKQIAKINAKKQISDNLFKSSDLSYFKTLFVVMIVMIGYNITNSIITSRLNVDISSVLSGLFSTGGIAVIIISLVRNLLASSITEIRKKMKNIDKQINEIRFFYKVRGGEAAFDYNFTKILPPIIKKIINDNKNISSKELKLNFDKLFEYTDFITNFKFNSNRMSSDKRRKFLLYRLYNEINTFDEAEDIKVNLLKEVKA